MNRSDKIKHKSGNVDAQNRNRPTGVIICVFLTVFCYTRLNLPRLAFAISVWYDRSSLVRSHAHFRFVRVKYNVVLRLCGQFIIFVTPTIDISRVRRLCFIRIVRGKVVRCFFFRTVLYMKCFLINNDWNSDVCALSLHGLYGKTGFNYIKRLIRFQVKMITSYMTERRYLNKYLITWQIVTSYFLPTIDEIRFAFVTSAISPDIELYLSVQQFVRSGCKKTKNKLLFHYRFLLFNIIVPYSGRRRNFLKRILLAWATRLEHAGRKASVLKRFCSPRWIHHDDNGNKVNVACLDRARVIRNPWEAPPSKVRRYPSHPSGRVRAR